MSQENVELVKRGVEAWSRRDLDGWLADYADDVEVVFPPDVPEPGPLRGRQELRAWAEAFLGAWEKFEVETLSVRQADDKVLVELRQRGHGRESGIQLDLVDFHVFTIRDGQVTRWEDYWNWADALEAAGLSE
jgi:ketosteroid isomerase-like protein